MCQNFGLTFKPPLTHCLGSLAGIFDVFILKFQNPIVADQNLSGGHRCQVSLREICEEFAVSKTEVPAMPIKTNGGQKRSDTNNQSAAKKHIRSIVHVRLSTAASASGAVPKACQVDSLSPQLF